MGEGDEAQVQKDPQPPWQAIADDRPSIILLERVEEASSEGVAGEPGRPRHLEQWYKRIYLGKDIHSTWWLTCRRRTRNMRSSTPAGTIDCHFDWIPDQLKSFVTLAAPPQWPCSAKCAEYTTGRAAHIRSTVEALVVASPMMKTAMARKVLNVKAECRGSVRMYQFYAPFRRSVFPACRHHEKMAIFLTSRPFRL